MIRPGAPADAAQMGAILSDWITQTPWMPRLHTPEQDAGFCAHLLETTSVRVVVIEGKVGGFLALKDAEIPALYLAPHARGQGHGKALLDAVKRDAPHLSLWTFQANARAIAFYQREGFAETLRTDGAGNDEALPDLRLEWSAQ